MSRILKDNSAPKQILAPMMATDFGAGICFGKQSLQKEWFNMPSVTSHPEWWCV
jgi:hypothetical protein